MPDSLRRWEYGDPSVILENRQSSSCLGCAQLEISRWGGTRKYVCSQGNQKASTEWTAMRRCRKYESEDV